MNNPITIEIPSNRVFGLDLIRAIAIIAVVIRHGDQLIPAPFSYFSYYFMPDGVTIFFVLSGFLIGNILFSVFQKSEKNNKPLFLFWTRRWLRTLPNYYLILFILYIIHSVADNSFSFVDNWKHLFFFQNIFTDQKTYFFIESWSLSIEEWFYIITPLLIVILIKLMKAPHRRIFLTSCIIIILFSILFKLFRFTTLQIEGIDEWDYYFKKPILARFDSLMIGVLGAYMNLYHKKKWDNNSNFLLAGGFVLFVLWKILSIYFTLPVSLYSSVFSTLLLSVATGMTLPAMSKLTISKKKSLYTIITKISLISYSLYLIHLSIVREWIIKKIHWDSLNLPVAYAWVIPYLAYILLSLFAATILYKYFEWPILKFRDRITKKIN